MGQCLSVASERGAKRSLLQRGRWNFSVPASEVAHVCIYVYPTEMVLKIRLAGDGSEGPFKSNDQHAAEALWSAAASGVAIAPPRLLAPDHDLASAYRIQALNVRRGQAIGRQVVGHKIGMTSAAIQKQFGIDHPTRGVLFSSMLHENGARLSFPVECSQGRAEGEIAFVLRHDLSRAPALGDMLDAIDYAIPAIEIVNSRIAHWDVTAFDFVADNAAAEFVILGSQRMDCRAADLKTVTMKMAINGENRSVGIGADCLGSPLHALHWLAIHLIENDDSLRKGDIVMSGSLGPAIGVGVGDQVDMYLNDGAPVTVRFH
jgi:2-keto-4-pentenoate hydratase